MTDVLSDLEKQGKLKKQKAGIVQVEGMLSDAIRDIIEAQKTKPVSERATFILAYNAMLKAGRALLLMNEYRPSDGNSTAQDGD